MGRRRNQPADYDGKTMLEDVKHELFCQIYTANTLPNYWGNGQNSYMFAFGHTERIDEINRKINGTSKDRKGESKIALARKIESIKNGCRAAAPKLLLMNSIKLRCNYLLDQLTQNSIVDRELAYVIQQRTDLDVKVRAIEHHDKREQRIREKVDLRHEFEPITIIEFVVAGKPKKVA